MNIADRIKKLQALANNPNRHEATAAAAKARELIARYGLPEADFGAPPPGASQSAPTPTPTTEAERHRQSEMEWAKSVCRANSRPERWTNYNGHIVPILDIDRAPSLWKRIASAGLTVLIQLHDGKRTWIEEERFLCCTGNDTIMLREAAVKQRWERGELGQRVKQAGRADFIPPQPERFALYAGLKFCVVDTSRWHDGTKITLVRSLDPLPSGIVALWLDSKELKLL